MIRGSIEIPFVGKNFLTDGDRGHSSRHLRCQHEKSIFLAITVDATGNKLMRKPR